MGKHKIKSNLTCPPNFEKGVVKCGRLKIIVTVFSKTVYVLITAK